MRTPKTGTYYLSIEAPDVVTDDPEEINSPFEPYRLAVSKTPPPKKKPSKKKSSKKKSTSKR
jgi:hypothetical protein